VPRRAGRLSQTAPTGGSRAASDTRISRWISVEAAIRSVTRSTTWAFQSEHETGSLPPGKLDDLVVLEEEPPNVKRTAISDIGISESWMDGRRVFPGRGAHVNCGITSLSPVEPLRIQLLSLFRWSRHKGLVTVVTGFE
jgi:hypothetical protein